MKSKQELENLRNILNQKQSNLNNLLSEKQNINNDISHYKTLNQTSGQDYNNSLKKLQDVENQILQYNKSIEETGDNIKVLEEKLLEISTFEDFMQNMDSILSEYTTIEGQKVDPSTMMVKALPQKEILTSDLHKDVCKKKCIEGFEKLLAKLDNVNAVDGDGRTLLMHTLLNGFFPAVDILLNHPDIDINILDNKGQNALVYACTMPHMDYVKKILDSTKDINIKIPETGNTPLHLVVATANNKLFGDEYAKYHSLLTDGTNNDYITGFEGNLIFTKDNLTITLGGGNPNTHHTPNQAKTLLIVNEFLQKGVELNTQNNKGHTPFTIACGYNLKYIVNEWLKKGLVDINFQDYAGKTILYWMCLSNNPDMAEYLSSKGADHTIAEKQGFYPIHGATHNGFIEVIKVMLKHGIDINTQSKDSTTPLYYSLGYTGQKTNINLVKFLLAEGANPNIEHKNGHYPIHAAINSKDIDVLQLFIKNNEDANKTGASGTTPLYFAVNYIGDIDIIDYLLEQGALPNTPVKGGFTPIYAATEKGRLDIIKKLVAKDGNIEQTIDCGDAPMSMAAYRGNLDIIKYYKDLGASINIKNKNGDMPIHEAHMGAKIEIVDYLLEQGVDINAKNLQGKTPLHFLLEWKETPLNEKTALLHKYIKKYDFSIQDKDGKTPIDYAKEHCPTIFSNIGLDINVISQEDNLTELFQNITLSNSHQEYSDNLESELIGKTGDME
jgi:ankyrin repeat protein